MSERREPGFERLYTLIERWAGRYADDLETVLASDTLRTEEARLLDDFEQRISRVLDEYPEQRSRKPHQLLFKPLYDHPEEDLPSERRQRMLIALMAAEVEAGGPQRLSLTQNKDLAQVFRRLGLACERENLMLHASEAFERAAELHLLTNEDTDRDWCLYLRSRARRRVATGWRRVLQTISGITCGYGYRPHLLLGWVIVQIVVFWLALVIATGGAPAYNFYLAAINYLNPSGSGEMNRTIKTILMTESYFGVLSVNVFFALIVRRWFR